jgi:hypothetical protein
LKRWLHEPLPHFLLIGAAIFALFYQVAEAEKVADNRIVISEGDIDRMITVWTDPDFDPTQKAFYYARVIEIPMPRWTAYDVKRYGIKTTKEIPMTTQERAYTSPIWYTP